MAKTGLLIAAPASGSGKTTLTLGLLAALKAKGVDVAAAKSGPDYLDPGFHQAACGRQSVNLDAWAMRARRLRQLAARQPGELLIVEGAMGLFDGAVDGGGSAADVAVALAIPVILVLDVSRQGQTAAAIAHGLAQFQKGLEIGGVILNRVGSARHGKLLDKAFADIGMPVLGHLPTQQEIALPSRHLGLIQAGEHLDLSEILGKLAELVGAHIDLDAVAKLAAPLAVAVSQTRRMEYFSAPGSHVALACDHAFGFTYPHMLDDWAAQGVKVSLFSPLADEAPDPACDAVFLPGGYPELFAARLAQAQQFHEGMQQAAKRGVAIYGECGGFMALGEGLVDAYGTKHRMLGLLPVVTSFAARRRQLGYRRLHRFDGSFWRAHEFHYATIQKQTGGQQLFEATASGETQSHPAGLVAGTISGSFMHLIDPEDDDDLN